MSRRALVWIAAALAAAAIAALLLWWLAGRGGGELRRAEETDELEAGEPAIFTLYFPGPGGRLHAEERELAVAETLRERARILVLALLEGPQTPEYAAPFPPAVGLLDLYLSPDGVAFVDLGGEGEGLAGPPAGGSREEMQRVYSVVATLTANLPGVARVALLWNGRQLPTFAGHLDTSRPLGPKRELMAPAPPREGP